MERKIHERKKNYGLLLLFTAINWVLIGLMVWKVDPETVRDFFFPGSYLPMMVLMAGGVFWLLSILFMSARQAARWTLGILVFLYLRVWGLGSLLNAILILGLLVCWEIYFRKGKKEIGMDSRLRGNDKVGDGND
jgi:hypothetical protein